MSTSRWLTGGGASVVLVLTGVWAAGPGRIDRHLWDEVRPVIEARLAADAGGGGYGETVPGLRTRWFCGAEPRDLDERDGVVRAGVTTRCTEYGVRDGALVECADEEVPQVVRLERDAAGGFRVVSREEAPDGEGNGAWVASHFGPLSAPGPDDVVPAAGLARAARAHFHLPAGTPAGDC
ncbi:hypothetical protein [Streptomyces collinus]|uniref:hypothetical protein n=1 Tax=Streptomyces collinus TaxID=42684 RepID=UPI002942121E|nr:hypothetical protein [Streptomyces collinus]